MARLVASIVFVVVLGGGAGSSSGAGGTSGLHGVLYRGPTQPVCFVNVPCSEPAAGVTLRFARAATVVARTRTDALGRYRIRLAPGTYAVRTSARPFGVVPHPARVRVAAGRFRRVDFEIDTGIR